jgi:hypothetical protein
MLQSVDKTELSSEETMRHYLGRYVYFGFIPAVYRQW